MKRAIFTALLLAAVPPAFAAEIMPDQLVRETAEKMGVLFKTDAGGDARDPQKLYTMIDFCEDVLPHIDFRAMAKATLGPHWRKADGNQRARFSREFRNHLVRTYSAALLKSTDQKIVYLPFSGKPGDKTAVVKTEVRQGGGAPSIPINYNFYKTDSVWKVYDISIDNVSLVTTYRTTYADMLQKQGVNALIANIAKSNKEPLPEKDGKR